MYRNIVLVMEITWICKGLFGFQGCLSWVCVLFQQQPGQGLWEAPGTGLGVGRRRLREEGGAGEGQEQPGLPLPAQPRARAAWWGTGREPAKGVRRLKSSQLPFSTRFCSASSEFRHLHSALSFQNNVGVPDIELCKQVCSQLREELLLPPCSIPALAQMCQPPEESHQHIFQKVSPSQNPIEWLFLINQRR